LACTQEIQLEIVSSTGVGDPKAESHPAATVGLPWRKPIIQIADSLQDNERTEAIAHEIGHLLLVYRFGLGLVGRRMPHPCDMEEICYYLLGMGQHWDYLLGQVINTSHHVILLDYLWEEYGIGSNFHLHLLHRHFEELAREAYEDRESLFAQGLITFEYQKLGGDVGEIAPLAGKCSASPALEDGAKGDNINKIPYREATPFRARGFTSPREEIRQSYLAAQSHFDRYHSKTIPSPSAYQKDILSFLEDLGYPKEGFVFFQARTRRGGQDARTKSPGPKSVHPSERKGEEMELSLSLVG